MHPSGLPGIRSIYCVGIGGIGMSGLAYLWLEKGGVVYGSDQQDSVLLTDLAVAGAQVWVGHTLEKIPECDVMVVSSAIGQDHPVRHYAKEKGMQVLSRGQFLAKLLENRQVIAVTGSHGKTTVTAWLVHVFQAAGLAPGYFIGGESHQLARHAAWGSGRYFVTEADESDRSLVHLSPHIVVLTNISDDHLAAGESQNTLIEYFSSWLNQQKQLKQVVLCQDDAGALVCAQQLNQPVCTYGEHTEAKMKIVSMQGKDDLVQDDWRVGLLSKLAGRHNVLNSAAVAAVAHLCGVEDTVLRQSMASFSGVARRFECLGVLREGSHSCIYIDDYAHHPNELKATLSALSERYPNQKLCVCFQPHRYSRTQQLFSEFIEVFSSIKQLVLLSVHASGESEIAGANSEALAQKCGARLVQDAKALHQFLDTNFSEYEVVLFAGAGSISQWARAWLDKRTGDVVC